MKPHVLLPAALMLLLPTSCTSSAPAEDVPCRCGTPLGDLEGCAHSKCRDGKNNPDNPDCVCGSLEIPAAKGK